ncbi:MAG: hypothetical protein CMJ49_12545 [Planctomycetaceae bacterium]|nr:hypothetical protein [Planctomycetaceae bacterium]
MSQQVMVERFFETLISGNRADSRAILDECLVADIPAERIIERLFWPTLEMIQKMYKLDNLSVLSHHFATRLLRMLVDQTQMRLEAKPQNGKRILLICGPDQQEELGAQMAADMLEAAGYEVFFAGGGVANDEIVEQIGSSEPDHLVVFSSAPSDLPHIRQLIDRIHDLGICPRMQVVVGGGVFNRADSLAQEIGADLWATTPNELVDKIDNESDRRAPADQRTVGRRRRTTVAATADDPVSAAA